MDSVLSYEQIPDKKKMVNVRVLITVGERRERNISVL